MFHNSLAIETSSREKHLERFSKFLGFGHFRDYFASGSLVTSLHREFRDSLVSGCPSCKKRLRQNFQNFLQGFLATRFGNLLVGYMSCENHVFCTNRVKSQTVFKNILVFPRITCITLCLLHLSQNRHSYSQNLHFLLQSFINLQEKVWAFSYFHPISSFQPQFSWILCLC